MTSFLRGLLRGGHSKHRKLLEDMAQAGRDCESEAEIVPDSPHKESVEVGLGIKICVKYLGSALMETPSGDVATAEAIKTVIAMAKASGRKLQRVILNVTLRGIKVFDAATEELQLDVSIYRISYCSADAVYSQVFAFICSNSNETMECHAFLCRKRKMAHCATLAIAKTFNTAFELWQLSHEVPKEERKKIPEKKELTKENEDGAAGDQENSSELVKIQGEFLIDFSTDFEIPVKENSWVSFDDDEDPEFKRRGPSLFEKKCPDSWSGSYHSTVDVGLS